VSPNFGDMNVVLHFLKPNINNLLISDPIENLKISKLESYTFRRSSFEDCNQFSEIGPIDFNQNLQLFWGEKDYGWLLLFIFMVIAVVTVFLIFKILLLLLSYGFSWNI
jgi:hypothetical protein